MFRLAEWPRGTHTHGTMGILQDDCSRFNSTLSGSLTEKNGTSHILSGNATAALYLFIVCIGVPANLLVLVVCLLKPFKSNVTSVYIGNLAGADVLLLSILPFFALEKLWSSWIFGRSWCKFCSFVTMHSFYTSVFSLAALSVDRYIAVVWPISAPRWRTITRARIVAVALWLFAAFPSIPPHILEVDEYLYSFVKSILGFILPVLFIGIISSMIVYKLMHQRRKVPTRTSVPRYRRSLYLLITVVVVFVICWMPFHLLAIIHSVCDHFCFLPLSACGRIFLRNRELATFLAYSNSCINPILYAFVGPNFRKSLNRLLRRSCSCLLTGKNCQKVNITYSSLTYKYSNMAIPLK
uniref:G-protein coupled receptors family 1 profile domain-containing protein n=1 Tax=Eptatretus burgeri TaxID=7764 RepID=A0A8C4PYL6_EPTBU